MKLKKKPKRIIITILIILLMCVCGFLAYKIFFDKTEVKENKVLKKIPKYGYVLKDNKTKEYKSMFNELYDILTKETVDEEEYVSKISEMFIYDFYSLKDKTAKTDVGGVDFVHKDVLSNFLVNAEDTYYRYLESNIYGNRKQKLPVVSKIEIVNITQEPFAVTGKETDEEAYKVEIKWTYKGGDYEDYQSSATLIFIHNDIRLDLVELK